MPLAKSGQFKMHKSKSFLQLRGNTSQEKEEPDLKRNLGASTNNLLEEEDEDQDSEESEDVSASNLKGKGKVISREIPITHRHDNSHVLSSNPPYYQNFPQDPYYPNQASDLERINQNPLSYSHNPSEQPRRYPVSNFLSFLERTVLNVWQNS